MKRSLKTHLNHLNPVLYSSFMGIHLPKYFLWVQVLIYVPDWIFSVLFCGSWMLCSVKCQCLIQLWRVNNPRKVKSLLPEAFLSFLSS